MGRDKAMIQHPDGGTFCSHAVHRLESLCEEVCLVGNLATPTELSRLDDTVPDAGPAGGVASALQHAASKQFDGVLVTPVDMPLLSTEDLRLLCDSWMEQPTQITVAVAGKDQKIEPLVAIYPVRFADLVQALATGRDRSLNRWVVTHSHQRVKLPTTACSNFNTPEDLDLGPEVSI